MKKIIFYLPFCVFLFLSYGFTYNNVNNISHCLNYNQNFYLRDNITTRGKVVEDFWEMPLQGAFVTIKNTYYGTVTDWNGEYTLLNTGDDTLVFSFLGYITQEVAVNNKSTINIYLVEDLY